MSQTRSRTGGLGNTATAGLQTSRCVCCGSDDLAASPAILMPFIAHRAFGWAPVEIDESWGLRTVRSGTAYSICNSLRCRRCSHLFCDIRFSDREMASLYAGYREEAYIGLRDHYEPGYRVRNAALAEAILYKPTIETFLDPYIGDPLTILDWGGDSGANTPFETRRASLDIFDISGKAVIPGARSVTRAQAATWDYRLIVCSQVLEHIPYPHELLLELRTVMNAETILYVEVPLETLLHQDRPDLERLKRHWHEHINFYCRSSMDALLRGAGFEVLDQAVSSINVAGEDARILQFACKLDPSYR